MELLSRYNTHEFILAWLSLKSYITNRESQILFDQTRFLHLNEI